MDLIGSEVRRELGRFGPAAGMAELVAAWPGAVGEAIARNAWPARLARDGTLHVAASSSAWAFELAQLEATIAGRLRKALGAAAPRRLRFAPGRLPEPPSAEIPAGARKAPEPTPAQAAQAARWAAVIEDEELRERVACAARASLARAPAGRGF